MTPPIEFVLDGSITLAWAFDDEANDQANAIYQRMANLHAHVPGVWAHEVTNVLVVGERRKRITTAQARQFLGVLQTLSIQVHQETLGDLGGVISDLARAHKLSVYDASYLELAIRLGLPLATKDAQLQAAAVVAGVALFTR